MSLPAPSEKPESGIGSTNLHADLSDRLISQGMEMLLHHYAPAGPDAALSRT